MQRSRRVAAVLALVALTLSLAESVWASTCAPMSASSTVAAVANDTPNAAECAGGYHGRHGEDGERTQRPGGEEPHCPFAPVVTPGCVAAAALPTSSAVPAPPAIEREVAHPAAVAASDLLLQAALFRPPRA